MESNPLHQKIAFDVNRDQSGFWNRNRFSFTNPLQEERASLKLWCGMVKGRLQPHWQPPPAAIEEQRMNRLQLVVDFANGKHPRLASSIGLLN